MSININQIKGFVKSTVKYNYKAVKETFELCKEKGIKNAAQVEKLGTVVLKVPVPGTSLKLNVGVTLMVNDLLFTAAGQKEIPAGMIMNSGINTCLIFVNEAWRKASKETRYAIVAHEIGHLMCGHLFKGSPLNGIRRMLGYESEIQKEIEADNYAISLGYLDGVREYLYEIDMFYLKNIPGSVKETKLRIDNYWKEACECNLEKGDFWASVRKLLNK